MPVHVDYARYSKQHKFYERMVNDMQNRASDRYPVVISKQRLHRDANNYKAYLRYG